MGETQSGKKPSSGDMSSLVAVLGRRLVAGGVRVGREVEANFRAWYERNFVDPRAGRIGGFSYSRAGALDDRSGDGAWYADAYARAWADYNEPLNASELAYVLSHPLIALQLSVGITDMRGLRCLRRGVTLRINHLQQRAYRSRYYGKDNARRRHLAAERRKITRRTTTNPCPTPDAFRRAFACATESVEAKILFGGMVHDLACYVDSCLRYDEAGNIVGRNGGIRGWMAENVPDLFPRYKTIMRYKALAMRLRQAVGLKDPVPTSSLLEADSAVQEGNATADQKGVMLAGRDKKQGDAPPCRGETHADHAVWGRNGVDKNYYAQDSYSDGEACSGPTGKDGRGDAGGGGHGSRRQDVRIRQDVRRPPGMCVRPKVQIRQDVRRPPGMCVRPEAQMRQESRRRQRKERMRRLLDGCRNTFKDVFCRIDAALGVAVVAEVVPDVADDAESLQGLWL